MNTIKTLSLKSESRVLLRVDFNVPLKDGKITDTRRIDAALPTINYLLKKKCRVIVLSHLGRPKGIGFEPDFSLLPIFEKLQDYLGKSRVKYADDVIGEKVAKTVNELQSGELLLLENLRFYKEEKSNDLDFAKKLASYGEYYINDAFGVMHRKHSSVYNLPLLFPVPNKCCGYLVEKELLFLVDKLKEPDKPYAIIIGGAKIADKIDLIKNMLPKADNVLIGGGMVFTFLKAIGNNIGRSLLEKDKIDIANEILNRGKGKIILPNDIVVVDDITNPTYILTKFLDQIDEKDIGVDIGKETINKFSEIVSHSKTIIFNGPMGIFEDERYERGTKKIIEAMTKVKGTTIVGGGDSAAAVKKFKMENKINHISTGGGASLELLSGNNLPGICALEEK